MGKSKQNKQPSRLSTVVETARADRSHYSLIDRHRPLSKPEFEIFDAIRDAVPIVDAAIGKIVRLVGGFKVECDDKTAEKELREFLRTVPSGSCSKGVTAFLNKYLDSLLMYGIAVGEMVGSTHVEALYNASLKGIEIITGDNPFDVKVSVRDGVGSAKPVKYPDRLLITAANPTVLRPEGRSLLEGLPFVTSVLLKIYDSIGTNFERMGNLRYAVTYRPKDSLEGSFSTDRAAEIAKEWSAAMSDKEGVRDFVAVGDVDIKVIGADNQMISSEVPVRQMLEQIVAKLGLPPFLLGLNWSSTERMSQQQADLLTTELEYYRGLLEQVIVTVCRNWLCFEGYYCDFQVVWDDITLLDEVEMARAALYRAQAETHTKENEVK